MVLHEQHRKTSEPLRWTRAGRIATAAVVAVLAVGTLAAVLASTGGPRLGPGCIDVTFASTLGAAAIHPCGARAREMCARPRDNPGLAEHGALLEACRKAGLPYG